MKQQNVKYRFFTNTSHVACNQYNCFNMTLRLFFVAILVSFLTNSPVIGQTIDTTEQTTEATQMDISSDESYDDDFAPGLLFFALIGIGLIFLCVGIGVVLAAIVLLILLGLVATGILSISVLVGLTKRSFGAGFKVFIFTSTCTGGLIIGTSAFYLLNYLLDRHFTNSTTLITGLVCGLVGGVLLGQIIHLTLQRLTNYARRRYATP
jgi:hypothetical protein